MNDDVDSDGVEDFIDISSMGYAWKEGEEGQNKERRWKGKPQLHRLMRDCRSVVSAMVATDSWTNVDKGFRQQSGTDCKIRMHSPRS